MSAIHLATKSDQGLYCQLQAQLAARNRCWRAEQPVWLAARNGPPRAA